MELQFSREIAQLRQGAGSEFRGEGILAITKALLQSGVSYVGGYQGSPVSHLLDVMVQARPYLEELGVKVHACSNEASAAAMLGASIHYPLRGAVTWKSIVGSNVASDALSNLASAGVRGGVVIVVGEDYGEGASVIQERSHAYALKSAMVLLDPRPDLPCMVDLVEHGFRISEAANMPVMLELRIRACHLHGSFSCKDNVAPPVSAHAPLAEPAAFDYLRLAHPPVTFRQEKLKLEERIPAARRYVREQGLNETLGADRGDVGLVVQGGLYNTLIRAMQIFGLADAFGETRLPLHVLNVTYPLVPEQLLEFCAGKRAVLLLEEGQPDYIEQELAALLRRHAVAAPLHGKDWLPPAGELTVENIAAALLALSERYLPDLRVGAARAWLDSNRLRRAEAARQLGAALPPRPPGFCIGCPERPVFAALKLAQQDVGRVHIAADIGCHSFGTFEPFSFGHTILGYGMSLASATGVASFLGRRTLAIVGDGGFWHNGLVTGVQSALLNGDDLVLLIFKNGYSAATGTQSLISSPSDRVKAAAREKRASLVDQDRTIERTLEALGVGWIRSLDSYGVEAMRQALAEALTTDDPGLKVIVAEGECQLERQRRVRPWVAAQLGQRRRMVRTRYGVDEDVCNGDHACMRLSGCPTLTLKDNLDPLKLDPVATVLDGCVGCGLCGSNALAARLCPSFYRVDVVQNPRWYERLLAAWRGAVIRKLEYAG
jgi:indolepyruvate ferredoxin oxidoreductase alpha subunit